MAPRATRMRSAVSWSARVARAPRPRPSGRATSSSSAPGTVTRSTRATTSAFNARLTPTARTSSATTTAIPTTPRRPRVSTPSALGLATSISSCRWPTAKPSTRTPSWPTRTAVRFIRKRWTCSDSQVSRPIVAIVGRPNVGKSTLFNRILGQRKAIVDAQSGLTRDRLYGIADWRSREFAIVDTAGLDLESAKDPSRAAIEAQTKIAIDQAHVIVLLLDVRQGLTPLDRDIGRLLRRSGRHVIVAATKADTPSARHFAHELLELGFDEPSLVSAQHGIGVGDLLDRVVDQLPPPEERPADEGAADRLAIMGRPNVGKSSLLNALLGDERALVSPTPGTTRDPIDTELIFDGVPVVLIDTAGIRRKSSSRDRLERYSLLRGIAAMERADTGLLVIEASAGRLAPDQHAAGYALEAGAGGRAWGNTNDPRSAA